MAKLANVLDPGARVQPKGYGVRFNERKSTHWGDDLRALVWNTPGDRIYAPCPATVLWVGWLDGTANARIPYHSGFAVWLDLGWWGGDHMYLLLTHCRSIKVRAGQRVDAGQFIATMGGSGWRDGPDWERFIDHLHIGVAQNTTKPWGVAKNYWDDGWIDPTKWFARHGVNFNTTPPANSFTLHGGSTKKEDTLSAAEVKDIKAHQTKEANRVIKAVESAATRLTSVLEDVDRKVGSNSQVAAWVKHDGEDVQTRQSLLDSETHAAATEAVQLLKRLLEDQGILPESVPKFTSQAVLEAQENADQ